MWHVHLTRRESVQVSSCGLLTMQRQRLADPIGDEPSPSFAHRATAQRPSALQAKKNNVAFHQHATPEQFPTGAQPGEDCPVEPSARPTLAGSRPYLHRHQSTGTTPGSPHTK